MLAVRWPLQAPVEAFSPDGVHLLSVSLALSPPRSMNWASCSGGRAPCDVDANLKCAIDVYRWGGNSFKLWSTCRVCGVC